MELNPIKHSLFREFQAITQQNSLKVHDQEIPLMHAEIRKIKKERAESVLDCAIDPMIAECHKMLIDIMPTNKAMAI